jgi:hypothetical protein
MGRFRLAALRFIKERLSRLTVGTVAVLILFGIPKMFGATQFWHRVFAWSAPQLWKFLGTPLGYFAVLACGLVVIWLDQARITKALHGRNGRKHHDITTLQGRTLKLRDDLQDFLNTLGPRPRVELTSEQRPRDFIEAGYKTVGPWLNKITYGYELRFAATVRRTYLEFAEQSLLPMNYVLNESLKNEEDIQQIIERLKTLAEKAGTSNVS